MKTPSRYAPLHGLWVFVSRAFLHEIDARLRDKDVTAMRRAKRMRPGIVPICHLVTQASSVS